MQKNLLEEKLEAIWTEDLLHSFPLQQISRINHCYNGLWQIEVIKSKI